MKGATDVNEQQRLSNAILRTQKAIDQQTASATKALATSKAFQQAVQQEAGIIQKLNDKLSDLKRARESQATVDGIKEINKALRETASELQRLTTIEDAEGGRSLLSTLLGAASGAGAGKQILQGALSGIGIGAGFSIIPAITSALVDYAKVMSDVEQRTEDVFAATKSLTEGLGGLLDVLTFSLCRAENGLAVGHLWFAHVGFHAEFALHAVNNNFQVQFAHTTDDGLAGFFVGVDAERRIFCSQT